MIAGFEFTQNVGTKSEKERLLELEYMTKRMGCDLGVKILEHIKPAIQKGSFTVLEEYKKQQTIFYTPSDARDIYRGRVFFASEEWYRKLLLLATELNISKLKELITDANTPPNAY